MVFDRTVGEGPRMLDKVIKVNFFSSDNLRNWVLCIIRVDGEPEIRRIKGNSCAPYFRTQGLLGFISPGTLEHTAVSSVRNA